MGAAPGSSVEKDSPVFSQHQEPTAAAADVVHVPFTLRRTGWLQDPWRAAGPSRKWGLVWNAPIMLPCLNRRGLGCADPHVSGTRPAMTRIVGAVAKVEFDGQDGGLRESGSPDRFVEPQMRPGDLPPRRAARAARHHRCSTINQTRGCFSALPASKCISEDQK